MQGNKKNQNYHSNQGKNQRIGQRDCQDGWNCQKILQNKCKFIHDKNDRQDILSLNRIKKGKIIIISDTYYKEIRPICLFQIYLPIKIVPNDKIKIEVGKYYVGYFVAVENRCALIEIELCLGNFGSWKIERNIFQNHMSPVFKDCKSAQNYKEKRGKINVNGALQKVLLGAQNLREYFQKVNSKGIYPLFEGCQIFYFEKNRSIQISRIRYPIQKFSGILQIDDESQFYFVSRNQNFDHLVPYRIPQDLIEQLKELTHCFPYTLLKKEDLKKNVQEKINLILREYLLKGQFEDWPIQSNKPIIALQNDVQTRNFKSQKEGIIYETGITLRSFTKTEKKQSDKILNKLKIKEFEKKRKILKGNIFTVDNKTTKCHDDALEIEQTQEGDFNVSIHIADIAEVINQSSSLDRNMKDRDSTLYFKDYFQPMIHETLRNKLSLKSGDPKLALTLTFKVSKSGQVDFSSVRFINSIIQVKKNLAHERLQKGIQNYPQLYKLSECLGRGNLLKQSSLIQYGSKSEFCMSRMIELSSMIPTVMLQLNIERTKQFKKKFDEYIQKLIQQKEKQMQEWENQVERINKVRKQLKMSENKSKKLKTQITKEINKEKQKLLRKIRQQMKAKTLEEKKQKKEKAQKIKQRMINGRQVQQFSDSQQEYQTQTLIDEEIESVGTAGVLQPIQIDENFEDFNEVMIKEKQKRAKALKQMKNKQNFVDIDSSSSESSQDDGQEDIELNNDYKMTKAMGGKRFLQKIFSHFKIQLQWLNQFEINKAFRTILNLDKGKLYQQYFKTVQITNRQHFPYITQAARKLKRQSQRNDDNKTKPRQPRQREQKRDRRPRRQQNQSRNQQKKRNDEKQQLPIKDNQMIQPKPKNQQPQGEKNPRKNRYQQKNKKPQLQKDNQISNNQKIDKQPQEKEAKEQLEKMKKQYEKLQKNISNLEQNYKNPFSGLPSVRPGMQYKVHHQYNQYNQYFSEQPGFLKQDNQVPKINQQLSMGMNMPPTMVLKSQLLQEKIPQKLSNKKIQDSYWKDSQLKDFKKNQDQFALIKKRLQNIKNLKNNLNDKQQSKSKNEKMIEKNEKNSNLQKIPNCKINLDKQINNIRNKMMKKYKQILTKQMQDVIKRLITNLAQNLKEVEEKYYNLINSGKNFTVEFDQEEKKHMNEFGKGFGQNYKFLKRKTIISIYKKIKTLKKKQQKGIKGNKQVQNNDQEQLESFSEDQEIVEIKQKKQKQKKNQKPRRQNKNKKVQKAMKKEENHQTKVQLSVEVSALSKAQTSVQQKDSAQICQKLAQKSQQNKPDKLNQAKIQQIQKLLPPQSSSQVKKKQNQVKEQKELTTQKAIQSKAQPLVEVKKLPAKKSKKEINKMVLELMKPISQQIKLKYKEELLKLQQEIQKLKQEQKDTGKVLKSELEKSTLHFNLIRLIADVEKIKEQDDEGQSEKESDNQSDEENGKGKKKNKKKNKKAKKSKKSKKKHQSNIFEQILQNFYSYADKSNHDFTLMKDQEIDEFLTKQLKFKEIIKRQGYSEEKINTQASKIASENMILKWNNPIRSYQSLMVMRLIKHYYWLFQGNIFPTEIVQYGDEIKKLDKKLKKLKDYHEDKIANGLDDKKVKQANREIDQLEFYYKLKKNPEKIETFLNITSPTPKIKRVYHEILGEVDLQNSKFIQEMYKQVKGRVKIVRNYPIKLKVEIIQ